MPQCGFSAKAVGALQDLGVELPVNVLADQEIREGIKAYGDWPTIPQLPSTANWSAAATSCCRW